MYESCLLGLGVSLLSSFMLLLFPTIFETLFSSFALFSFEWVFRWINALPFSKAFLVPSIIFFQMSCKRLMFFSHSFSHSDRISLLKISGMLLLSRNSLISLSMVSMYHYCFENTPVYWLIFPFPILIFLVLDFYECSFLDNSWSMFYLMTTCTFNYLKQQWAQNVLPRMLV